MNIQQKYSYNLMSNFRNTFVLNKLSTAVSTRLLDKTEQ